MRARAILALVVLAVISVIVSGCDPALRGAARTATPSPAATSAALDRQLPSGFRWVGGPENGLRFAVPASWVDRPLGSDELRRRHAIAVVDAKGAEDFDKYEAHLIASCKPNPGISSMEQLEAVAPQVLGSHANLSVSSVDVGGRVLVTASYDDRNSHGDLEHWYEYVFLASGNRLCLITLTTPLEGPARAQVEAVFDGIGPTIDVLAPLV